MESLIKEHDDPNFSLENRFGSTDELAAKYLEDHEIKPSLLTRLAGAGKIALISVGVLSILVVGVIAGVITIILNIVNEDDFNYADETHIELDTTDSKWIRINADSTFKLVAKRSFVVLYWHNKDEVLLNCEHDDEYENASDKNEKLEIHYNKCLVFLPTNIINITSYQSKLTMVRPQADLDIEIEQSDLRIAENKSSYLYQINKEDSEFKSLTSSSNPQHKISINALESKIEAYEY